MSEYTIIGAGAIGSIVGVSLIEAGHDVRFIDRNHEHVAAVVAGGLRLSGAHNSKIAVRIATPQEANWPLCKILLAVKSPYTIEALSPFVERIAPSGYVLSLQNGLEEYRIADLVGAKRTIGAFLTFGGYYKQPGEIIYGGRGTFCVGELDGSTTPRLLDLADDLSALQPATITDNIFGFLWSKMALGAIYFATATTNTDVTKLYAIPRYREIFGQLAGEVVAVCEVLGVRMETIDGFDPKVFRSDSAGNQAAIASTWKGQVNYWNRHDNKRTGIWRDLAVHKRKTEVDRLIGAIIETAHSHGLATPHLNRLLTVIKQIETNKLKQKLNNLKFIYSN